MDKVDTNKDKQKGGINNLLKTKNYICSITDGGGTLLGSDCSISDKLIVGGGTLLGSDCENPLIDRENNRTVIISAILFMLVRL